MANDTDFGAQLDALQADNPPQEPTAQELLSGQTFQALKLWQADLRPQAGVPGNAVLIYSLICAFVILGLLAMKAPVIWRAAAAFAIKGTNMVWRAGLAFTDRCRAELKKVSPLMKPNIIIAVLALLWIAANAAHAYTFFHGSASNSYVKCMEGWSEVTNYEEICTNAYPKHRDTFEQDRLGVTLKSILNATGLAFVACFLIIGARRVSAALKSGREEARNG